MKKYIKVEELCCAHCASRIEKEVKKLPAVRECSVSFMAEKMLVEYDDSASFEELFERIRSICVKVEPECRVSV